MPHGGWRSTVGGRGGWRWSWRLAVVAMVPRLVDPCIGTGRACDLMMMRHAGQELSTADCSHTVSPRRIGGGSDEPPFGAGVGGCAEKMRKRNLPHGV